MGEDSIKTAEEFFKMGRVQAMTQSKNVFKMADILLEMDDDTWTWGYPYNSPVLGEMADNVWNLGFLPAAHRPQAVVPVMQWMQNMPLLKSETVEYCMEKTIQKIFKCLDRLSKNQCLKSFKELSWECMEII